MSIYFDKSKLYNKNSVGFIKRTLKITDIKNLKNLDRSKYYSFSYFEKHKKIQYPEGISRYEIRKSRYLCFEKQKPLKEKPSDYSKSKYRAILTTNNSNTYSWIKKSQKLLNSFLSKLLSDSDIPYLQSTRKTVSNITNVSKHLSASPLTFFTIDLKNFFTQISETDVTNFFIHKFRLQRHIAELYAKLTTSPSENNSRFELGQGLPTSPSLAFLIYSDFFEFLYNYCLERNITMTVYVDDITFSTETENIDQSFINEIIGLFKHNGLIINKKKIHYIRKGNKAEITGIFAIKEKMIVKNNVHEKIKTLYNVLKLYKKEKDVTIGKYLFLFDCFLSLRGTFNYLASVEFTTDSKKKKITPCQYIEIENLINELTKLFPSSCRKIDKSKGYSLSNVSKENYKKFYEKYDQFKKYYLQNDN